MKHKGFGWEASSLIAWKFREKISTVKKDRHLLALLFTEFALSMTLVTAIVLYLDGRYNIIEYPFNLMIFAVLVFGVMHVYRYTEKYRDYKGMKKEGSFKIMVLELALLALFVAGIYVYQDPNLNIVPSACIDYLHNQYSCSLLGVGVFLLVALIPLYFYINEKFVKKQIH